MPLDNINNIMTFNQQWEKYGLGKSGETYLVADDTSNDLPFEVNTVEVQLDFGDKGSDNGDTFALFMELNYDAAKSPLEGSLAIARNLAMMNAWVMPS